MYYASLFFFNDTATTEIYTLSLHDALPIFHGWASFTGNASGRLSALSVNGNLEVYDFDTVLPATEHVASRSEEHTSELQSPDHLVCRLLLEKKKHINRRPLRLPHDLDLSYR